MKNFKTALKAFMILFAVFMFLGCGNSKPQLKTEYTAIQHTHTADSTARIEKNTIRLITIPASSAKLNLNLENLAALPIGAKYQEKQGQATLTVEKTGDNDYNISADCDSLSMIVAEKETEIYHLQNKVKELAEKEAATKEIPIYKQTTWQIVCGWFGKVFMFILSVGLGIGIITIVLKWKRLF